MGECIVVVISMAKNEISLYVMGLLRRKIYGG